MVSSFMGPLGTYSTDNRGIHSIATDIIDSHSVAPIVKLVDPYRTDSHRIHTIHAIPTPS